MSSRLLTFPFLVIGALVLAASCRATEGSSIGVGIALCAENGAPCAFAADCCGNACIDGHCAAAFANCIVDNDGPCKDDAQCCSNICGSDGNCAVPACALDGQACATDSDCCDQEFCDEAHGGVCAICLDGGAACGSDADCCSFICKGGSCGADGAGAGGSAP